MKINVFWKSINIMNIIKEKKAYITDINYDNFVKANKEGMPLSIFLDYSIVSAELPDFVKSKLPTPKMISNEIDKIGSDKNVSIIDYINKTKCKCATDNFEITLEE